MRTSCLIPSYNAAGTLRRAIASARHFDECIVWVDGSRTNDMQCASQFPQVAFHRSRRNFGIPITRHRLYTVATGDAIAYLDADDTRIDGQLAPQLACLERSGADFVYAPVRRPQGKLLKLDPDPIKTILGQHLQTNGLLIRKQSLDQMFHTLGYTWRLGSKMRYEYWFMFDLLRCGLRGQLYNSAVANYEPGDFTAAIAPGDRLKEYGRFTVEVKKWLGAERWPEYEAIADQVESSLRWNEKSRTIH